MDGRRAVAEWKPPASRRHDTEVGYKGFTQGGTGEDGANPSLPRNCHRNETRKEPLFRIPGWEGAGSRTPEARRSGLPCIKPRPFEGKEEQ